MSAVLHDDTWRPVAYVAVADKTARTRVIAVLEQSGWAVIPQPTGFHVLQAISDVIDGHQSWLQPNMIVIDAFSRGCAGTTIAAGLRDLGITIPIVLVAAPGAPLPISADDTLRIIEHEQAEPTVRELARAWAHSGARTAPMQEASAP